MSLENEWKNNKFGKNGFYYPLLYLLPIPLLLNLAVFLWALFFVEAEPFTNAVLLFAALVMCIFIARICKGINVGRSLVKQVRRDDKGITANSFSGKVFVLDKHVTVSRDEEFFSRKYLRFLFKEDNNFVLKVSNKAYFLSGEMDNMDELIGHILETCTVRLEHHTCN